MSLKCFMHLLFRCLSTLSLYCRRNQTYILALPDAHKLHWSSDIGAQSRSISTTLPVRSVKLIFDFVTVRMMSLQPLTASSSSSPSLSELSGNEVGLRDDALHFVICRICCGLVVTDGHFMSVSLKRGKQEETIHTLC